MTQEAKVLKMSDLVRLSGVSKQTIHFYLREGLLLPPVRASKNMAYYDESTVEDIRFIKEMQDIKIYADFLNLVRSEAILVHDRIIHRNRTEKHQPLNEIQAGLEQVKSLLTAKAYRELSINHRHNDGTEKGED